MILCSENGLTHKDPSYFDYFLYILSYTLLYRILALCILININILQKNI